jgi:hypothetical protein
MMKELATTVVEAAMAQEDSLGYDRFRELTRELLSIGLEAFSQKHEVSFCDMCNDHKPRAHSHTQFDIEDFDIGGEGI